jgi:molybdopterin/thiamine biosynthesis adenylyltransferase
VTRVRARVLIVGIGGIGCPAAMALARAGVGDLGICDDDEVELSNLHRQVLFSQNDVGLSKVDAAARHLAALARHVDIRPHRERLLPDRAVELVRGYDVVLEGADNFATKFLAADACRLAGVPVVHASAVRWVGTALAVGARGRPCYRCLFENLPADGAPGCAQAGVMGPVPGIIAAAQADLALALIDGEPVAGQLVTFDGRSDVLRRRQVPPRADCDLCGPRPLIRQIEHRTYLTPPAQAQS